MVRVVAPRLLQTVVKVVHNLLASHGCYLLSTSRPKHITLPRLQDIESVHLLHASFSEERVTCLQVYTSHIATDESSRCATYERRPVTPHARTEGWNVPYFTRCNSDDQRLCGLYKEAKGVEL